MALQPLFIRGWKQLSAYFEFLSVRTLSNVFNGCRDFFSLRPDVSTQFLQRNIV